VAIPKIWVLNVDANIWTWSWLGGGLAAGFTIALAWTYCFRRSPVDAALELDRRFGLKERVSSSLTLSEQERASEAGRALLEDASRRVETLDVKDQFAVKPGSRLALPLLPIAALVMIVLLMNNAIKEADAKPSAASVEIQKVIKDSDKELQKLLAKKREEAEKKGLEDAEAIFKQIQEMHNEQAKSKDPIDQKKALIKLSDLAKELQDRRDKLGGADKVKDQLGKLKDIEQGPADKAVKSLQQGDFEKAQEEMKKLQEKLKNGELTKEEQEQLAKQLGQMQQKVEELAEKHEQLKKDLEEQIKEAEQRGDREKAGQLQQKLDAMKNADKQMEKLQQMADKLGKAAEAAKNGDNAEAAKNLEQIAKDLKEMQKDLDNMQMVDEMMNEVAQAKNGLCEKCEGLDGDMEGEGEGEGKGKGKGEKPGRGMGEGQGVGARDEEKNETSFYESKVRATPKKGEAVKTGDADGPNLAGRTAEAVKEEINATTPEEDDPLVEQRLPKAQREHTKEYFDRLRKGE
jgi:hypothetical protein